MSSHPRPGAFTDASKAASHDAAPDAPQPPPTIRHDGWSLDKQTAFLRALSATHSVTDAAQAVGMSRQSAYRLRSRLKGQAFDLAWEVAFHHSYDVLAHAALERALNGVEVPVWFKGEQVGSYRRYDERLTVALLHMVSGGGNPVLGRLGPGAEIHARDFEGLLARVESGEAVKTGAPGPADPSEIAAIRAGTTAGRTFRSSSTDPSTWSDAQLAEALQELGEQERK